MNKLISLSLLLITLSLITTHAANDTINVGRNITDTQTLISPAGIFELGFWSPGSTAKNWYIATWYRNRTFPVVLWIANRQTPIATKSTFFKLIEPGILTLLNDDGGVVWSSTTSRSVKNPIAQLLDSGNLVIKDGDDDDNILWQSFDHPTDTYLPGMKLGLNYANGLENYLSSWTSDEDPSQGRFSMHVVL